MNSDQIQRAMEAAWRACIDPPPLWKQRLRHRKHLRTPFKQRDERLMRRRSALDWWKA